MCKMLSVWWLFCTTMYPRNVSSFYRPCLWHGEKMEVLNKMKNNFQVRKKSAGYCCGLMFAKAAQMLLGQEKESASWRVTRIECRKANFKHMRWRNQPFNLFSWVWHSGLCEHCRMELKSPYLLQLPLVVFKHLQKEIHMLLFVSEPKCFTSFC